MKTSIIRQIIELENKSVTKMRQIYNEIMPKNCTPNTTKEYLRPRITYCLQELALGGLSDEAKEKLSKLASGLSMSYLKHHSELLPGTKICREWNNVMHEVEVLKDCFEYQGQKFKSLSSIARKITGTRWNGPKFFKLKS
jgi:Protein of unknown function (DUF2924)